MKSKTLWPDLLGICCYLVPYGIALWLLFRW